ncbi:hypothetical protein CU669_15845 [Paramagnetospirillum kuznetsovii]|uniref:Ancillary SecYEG translocon subunit n=1 Tax=Paramagnetospirillum kuznetsovii TaxID=2053833 RepID=A0A364NV15_9PROT|nr:tetratricopeptide repeat protein [Paramagnetospirillum kuznetsovii]RAU20906.1 hypothetical protein CU669_15845 [Paramagnetospirillum kuznetsovii]
MTDKTDDAATDLLIKEVDEDLRQEQLEQTWKKYGSLITGGAVAIVLAVAGWQGWTSYDLKQRQASSLRYAEAAGLAEQGRKDEATETLEKLKSDGTKGYRALADMRLADLKQQAGDFLGAAALYQRLAADSGVDKVYRDMATIRAAYLVVDTADPAALDKSLEPLAAESSSWRHSAREIQALTALKRGDDARAADLFAKIAEDAAAPQGLRTRAAEMLAATSQRARS